MFYKLTGDSSPSCCPRAEGKVMKLPGTRVFQLPRTYFSPLWCFSSFHNSNCLCPVEVHCTHLFCFQKEHHAETAWLGTTEQIILTSAHHNTPFLKDWVCFSASSSLRPFFLNMKFPKEPWLNTETDGDTKETALTSFPSPPVPCISLISWKD